MDTLYFMFLIINKSKMLPFLLLINLVSVVVCEVSNIKPNFVVIVTDDQDVVLNGMTPMKNVQRFIANEGVTFKNSYTTSPICCPSRASLLTGLYVHHHLTQNNSLSGGCNGRVWRKREQNTFATALHDVGYTTFYAGKYLNEYGSEAAGGPERVPPGWSDWHGLVGNSVYFNYTISHNGVPERLTDVYLTDLIRTLSIDFIDNQTSSAPFLMVLAPPAPHQPFTPAARHRGAYNNVSAVRSPNFNVAVTDKHWLLTMPPSPLPEDMMPELDRVFRSRWETLLAVDEMVADVVGALDNAALLDNTYIIYTSDNGYHIGQYAQAYDKRQPYESDIKVPLLIKGPGISKNTTNDQPVLNIDLAPTIIQLAGLQPPENMDGIPLEFDKVDITESYLLIEYYGEGRDESVDPQCPWKYDGDHLAECYPEYDCKCQDSKNNTFACVRHIAEWVDFKYCLFAERENFEEIYDLKNDPYELRNIVNEVMPAIKHKYKFKLSELLPCNGIPKCERLVKTNFRISPKRSRSGVRKFYPERMSVSLDM